MYKRFGAHILSDLKTCLTRSMESLALTWPGSWLANTVAAKCPPAEEPMMPTCGRRSRVKSIYHSRFENKQRMCWGMRTFCVLWRLRTTRIARFASVSGTGAKYLFYRWGFVWRAGLWIQTYMCISINNQSQHMYIPLSPTAVVQHVGGNPLATEPASVWHPLHVIRDTHVPPAGGDHHGGACGG